MQRKEGKASKFVQGRRLRLAVPSNLDPPVAVVSFCTLDTAGRGVPRFGLGNCNLSICAAGTCVDDSDGGPHVREYGTGRTGAN